MKCTKFSTSQRVATFEPFHMERRKTTKTKRENIQLDSGLGVVHFIIFSRNSSCNQFISVA